VPDFKSAWANLVCLILKVHGLTGVHDLENTAKKEGLLDLVDGRRLLPSNGKQQS